MGPLRGIRVLEFEGVGPAPHCGLMLADMGADVLLIDRPQPADLGLGRARRHDTRLRGRRSLTLDLKAPDAASAALELVGRADILIEGFRPGVMERLGIGPEACLERNPRLLYGRVTGWGREGPLAAQAGHDLNYIALTGILDAIGRAGGPPTPPLNLVADYGGGGLLLAFGLVCALVERTLSSEGQVVDAAMLDGSALLAAGFYAMYEIGAWTGARGENDLDSGAPWYDIYATRDGRYVAVAALEERFYQALLEGLGIAREPLPERSDRAGWPVLRARFAALFRTRTMAEWEAIFDNTDACVSPVLSFSEAPEHPQARIRGSFTRVAGLTHPAPAPRFGRTPGGIGRPAPERGEGGRAALRDWGVDEEGLARLRALGLGMAD